MARRPDIQYIRFYTDGSAAKKLAPAAPVHQVPKKNPKARRPRRIVIHVDPVAILGIVVAAVMLVCMLVGVSQLSDARAKTRQMARYVTELTNENARLQDTYAAGYDLETVRASALALGLVPIEQVEHVGVQVKYPQPEPEKGPMDDFVTYLTDLFA